MRCAAVLRGGVAPLAVCLVGAALLLTGCETMDAVESADEAKAGAHAQRLLDGMLSTYRKAQRYSDEAELNIRVIRKNENQTMGPLQVAVAYERPNKLRLQAYEANLVSDGRNIKASLGDVPGQVLAADAPERLSPDVLKLDPLLATATTGLAGVPITLRMLLDDPALDAEMLGDHVPKMLADERLEGRICHRVRTNGSAGKYTFWIDADNHLLRRLDVPIAIVRDKIDPDRKYDSIECWMEFKNAQLDAHLSKEAFQFDAAGARLVQRFITPVPEPPSEMLGKKVENFSFDDLNGKRVTAEDLRGKVVVLDWWATWCGWCFKGFPNVQKVRDEFKDNDKVKILTVNSDESDVADADVKAAFAKAGVTLPLVRDVDDADTNLFNVKNLPTMFVLDAEGKVQIVEVGYHADLATTLPERIKRILAGDDLPTEMLAAYEKERAEFEKKLSEVLVTESTVVEIPQIKIPERTEPARAKLERMWTAAEVSAPGNILVVGDDAKSVRILAIDSSRSVVELDASGKVIAHHELEIPEREAVSYLRTAVGRDGKRCFVAFAITALRLYLFDEQWKLIRALPDTNHPGIADVQFSDLDADGQVELNIGYQGAAGVHHVALDGKRLWSDRSLENVYKLAVVDGGKDKGRMVLCTNGTGTLGLFDKDGKRQEDVRIAGHAIHTVVPATFEGQTATQLCGLSATDERHTVAVGFDLTGRELWKYALPLGLHQQPIEMATSGPVLPDGAGWVLAAADGSIHFLDRQGAAVDKFNYGAVLTGIAATRLDGRSVLVVSGGKQLTAWAVDWPR